MILTLNQQFELEYIEQAKQIDRELEMKYMSTIERLGYQQGEASLLIKQLKIKFSELPQEYINKINQANANTLDVWGTNFVFANTLDEVFTESKLLADMTPIKAHADLIALPLKSEY